MVSHFSVLTAAIPRTIGHTVALLVMVRVLLGTGEAIMVPALNQFVARWIPSYERGKVHGINFAGEGSGSANIHVS